MKIPSVSAFVKKFLYGHPNPPEMHDYVRRAWLDSNKAITSVWDSVTAPFSGSNDSDFKANHSIFEYCPSFFEAEKYLCLNSLHKFGYYVFNITLSPEFVLQLLDEMSSAGLKPELGGQKQSERLISRDESLLSCNLDSLRLFYPKDIVNSSTLVASLAHCPSLLSIVSEYLNGKQFISTCSGWLSIGKRNQDAVSLSNAAQEFHFDFDALKFLKVFVCLSDVDENSGAHQVISASHRPFPKKCSYTFPTYFRASKNQLLTLYAEDCFRTLKEKKVLLLLKIQVVFTGAVRYPLIKLGM